MVKMDIYQVTGEGNGVEVWGIWRDFPVTSYPLPHGLTSIFNKPVYTHTHTNTEY